MDDEVVSIEIEPFDGEVFNISVDEDESYILNYIVTHNCLCFKTAVLPKPDEFTNQLRGWTDGSQPWPAMDNYASMVGGDVSIDLAGMGALATLLRWAFNPRPGNS